MGQKHRCYNKNSGVENLWSFPAKAIFIKVCPGCKKIGEDICKTCTKNLYDSRIDFPICIRCENLSINGKTHLACKKNTFIDQFFCPYPYQGITKKIIRLKGRNKKALNSSLKSQPNKELTREISEFNPNLIIPIPSTPKKFKPRLVEPAFIIAGYIQAGLESFQAPPQISYALYKSPLSKQQKDLNVHQRQNPKIKLKAGQQNLLNRKRILLVDDVCTTGSTLNIAAKLLKTLGATEVAAYTLARDMRYNRI